MRILTNAWPQGVAFICYFVSLLLGGLFVSTVCTCARFSDLLNFFHAWHLVPTFSHVLFALGNISLTGALSILFYLNLGWAAGAVFFGSVVLICYGAMHLMTFMVSICACAGSTYTCELSIGYIPSLNEDCGLKWC